MVLRDFRVGAVLVLLWGCDASEEPAGTDRDAGVITGVDAGTERCAVGEGQALTCPPVDGEAARVAWTAVEAAAAVEAGGASWLDARAEGAFEAQHAAGALWLDVASLRAEVDGVPAQVPPASEVAARLSQAGLSPDDPVVVYAEGSDLAAARMVWTLKLMGHARVHMVDGGFPALLGSPAPLADGPAAPQAATYPSDAVDEALRVDTAWVEAHLDDPDVVLIDARSADEFALAHIPGAINLDWQGNVEDGRLLPRAELEARHADVPRDATVVAYCQTGSRASMAWLTLVSLEYPDARLYDGSMAAWLAEPGRPLE